ncbi:MAG: DoxX family protein [Bacteroidetes bacterium]|nr:DoxX family protein [Bacteroidota bacterium]MCH8524254.1 DoxX family protein [Balneolales bacterium]
MNKLESYLLTDTSRTTILIRFLVGIVFVTEGIQKFLYPAIRGAGRFESIGIPFPEFNGYFVGASEIIFGAMVLVGICTRFAAIPLIIIMLVAMFTTKLPILLGTGFWGFSLRELQYYGFLSMMHESRNDLAMLIGSIFLLIKGGGYWSMDLKLWGKRNA